MQKKIYSLLYVCVLDNLNSIGQNGSQATIRVLRVREWLFSSKRYKSEKCQLHWLYLRREDLNKKTSNVKYIVLKPDTCILWRGNEPFVAYNRASGRHRDDFILRYRKCIFSKASRFLFESNLYGQNFYFNCWLLREPFVCLVFFIFSLSWGLAFACDYQWQNCMQMTDVCAGIQNPKTVQYFLKSRRIYTIHLYIYVSYPFNVYFLARRKLLVLFVLA